MSGRKLYRGSSSVRIVDILDAVGSALTSAELETEYVDRFGPISPDTLRQSCRRLCDEGFLDSRLVENPLNPNNPRFEYWLARRLDTSRLSKLGLPPGRVASMTPSMFWDRVKARQDAYFDGVRP